MIRKIKEKLRNGEATVGSWMQIPSSSVGEMLGRSGYDWVAVDLEHGQFSTHQLPDIFRAIELGGTAPFVRVAQACAKDIKQALDAGAKGLIFPMIETSKQLQNGILNSFYTPKGNRGVGYSRANLFGKNFEEYVQKKSQDTVIVAQIEHVRAVENLDEILSVKGLDAIMVGPYDLSGSIGITGQFEHPDFTNIMDSIINKARNMNIPMGMHVVQPDKKILEKKIMEGYQFIAYGIDAVFFYNASENPVFNK